MTSMSARLSVSLAFLGNNMADPRFDTLCTSGSWTTSHVSHMVRRVNFKAARALQPKLPHSLMRRCDVTVGHYYRQLMTAARASCRCVDSSRISFNDEDQELIVGCAQGVKSAVYDFLVNSGATDGLCVYRKMFWSECGSVPTSRRIVSASMDVTNIRTLVADVLQCPISLHLDLPSARLYWAEHQLNYIDSIGVDGTRRRV